MRLEMGIQAFEDRPPVTERVNAYDEQHLVTYLRLLDADAEGADWREVVLIVFGLDPRASPSAPRSFMTATWLARAG